VAKSGAARGRGIEVAGRWRADSRATFVNARHETEGARTLSGAAGYAAIRQWRKRPIARLSQEFVLRILFLHSCAAGVQLTSYRAPEGRFDPPARACPLSGPRQRLIFFLAADVSDVVLLIAILDEDRTFDLLIVEFVIIFSLG
jgi:hypothetical protein